MNGVNAHLSDKVQRRRQTGDPVTVQRPCLQTGGHLGGMGTAVALHAAAAHLPVAQRQALTHAQSARSLRAHQALMAGKAQHIDARCRHVDGIGPCRLRRIHDQQHIVCLGHSAHTRQVGQIARQIGRMGTDNGPCMGLHQAFKGVVVQIPLPVRRHKAHFHALFIRQTVQRTQHAVMLAVGGDHMVAPSDQAVDGNVQRLGDIGRKRHTVGPGTAKELRQLYPGIIYGMRGRHTACVGAPGAVAHGLQRIGNGLDHLRRLMQRGGGIIQINHHSLLKSTFHRRPRSAIGRLLPHCRHSPAVMTAHSSTCRSLPRSPTARGSAVLPHRVTGSTIPWPWRRWWWKM